MIRVRMSQPASVEDIEMYITPPLDFGTFIQTMFLAGGGTRLVYARGPEGRHTWMVELGADGRVQRWHQALSEAAFARIVPGMSADELLRDFGPPGHRQPLGWQPWVVWSWRYPTYECLWFRVTLDRAQRVVETSYGPDPLCDVDDDRTP